MFKASHLPDEANVVVELNLVLSVTASLFERVVCNFELKLSARGESDGFFRGVGG